MLANTGFRDVAVAGMKNPDFLAEIGVQKGSNLASTAVSKAYDFTRKPLAMALHVNRID